MTEKGVDIVIAQQVAIFQANLWTANKTAFYAMCDVNYRNVNGSLQQVPEIVSEGNNYIELLLDDKLDAISFFDILSERTDNLCKADIYFAVNLKHIYPYAKRGMENALCDAALWIKRGGLFKIETISDDVDSWSKWAMVKKTDNMNPFYLFRFHTNVSYILTC